MISFFKVPYNIDMVFCIDVSMSMANVMNNVKDSLLAFPEDITYAMKEKNVILNLRIKLITFRDYIVDDEEAMLSTKFFNYPDEASDFRRAVQSIQAKGGGDIQKDGLEALAYAIRSDWTKEGVKRRHIISVWSDAAPHPLGASALSPYYPANMAKSFSELTNWWGNRQYPGYMGYRGKRLLLFTPEEGAWSDIFNNWDEVILFPSIAGKGFWGWKRFFQLKLDLI